MCVRHMLKAQNNSFSVILATYMDIISKVLIIYASIDNNRFPTVINCYMIESNTRHMEQQSRCIQDFLCNKYL